MAPGTTWLCPQVSQSHGALLRRELAGPEVSPGLAQLLYMGTLNRLGGQFTLAVSSGADHCSWGVGNGSTAGLRDGSRPLVCWRSIPSCSSPRQVLPHALCMPSKIWRSASIGDGGGVPRAMLAAIATGGGGLPLCLSPALGSGKASTWCLRRYLRRTT